MAVRTDTPAPSEPAGRTAGTIPASRRVVVRPGELGARQGSLFEAPDAAPTIDRQLSRRTRHELAGGAWVDVVERMVGGSHALFDRVVAAADWRAEEMVLFDELVACPRLSVRWTVGELPDELAVLRSLGAVLSQHYRVALTSVSANLYRDGSDSVAWHGDRGARDRDRATIAVLTLGSARPFRLRQRNGPGRLALEPASGDLLVMGGTCQRTWQHSVPKVADAGPRISVMFRTRYDG